MLRKIVLLIILYNCLTFEDFVAIIVLWCFVWLYIRLVKAYVCERKNKK